MSARYYSNPNSLGDGQTILPLTDQYGRLQVVTDAAAVGVPTTMTVTQLSLSAAVKQILLSNSGRTFVEIKNLDATTNLFFAATSLASSLIGYAIKAGEAFALDSNQGPLFAITSGGAITVNVVEW